MTKRYLKLLIGIIVAAIIAVGAYVGVSLYKKSENNKLSDKLKKNIIFDFDENNILQLKIHNSDGDYIFKIDGDEWVMTQGDNISLSPYKLSSISNTLSTLKADGIIDENVKDSFEKYGLDNSMIITAVLSDGNEYSIEIGDQVPGDSRYYARKSGENTVYVIASECADVLWSDKNDLKNTYLFDVSNVNQIQYLKYKCEDNTIYEINKEDDKWKIVDPCPTLTVNNAGVESILSELIRATSVSFIDEGKKDLSAYGLDDPSYEISVRSADKQADYIFGDYYDDQKEYIYAQNKETGQICVFPSGSLGCIGTKTEDVLFRIFHSVTFTDMDTFDIDMFGEKMDIKYHYSVTNNLDNDFVINDKKIDVTDETTLDAFNSLINSIIGMAYDNICELSDETILQNQPDAHVIYHMMDGSEYKLEFFADPSDQKKYYVTANGEFTGTSINASSLKNGVCAYYDDLMDLFK